MCQKVRITKKKKKEINLNILKNVNYKIYTAKSSFYLLKTVNQ